MQYVTERNFFFVHSKDRDTTKYLRTSEFKIDIPNGGYKEVLSIELIGGTVPNLDSVNIEPHLLLSITDLNHLGTTDTKEYFSILSLHKGHSDTFFNIDRSSSKIMPNIFEVPKKRLDSLDIQLLKSDGTRLAFGGTTGSVAKTDQVTFTFEIKTQMPARIGFDTEHRGVRPQ